MQQAVSAALLALGGAEPRRVVAAAPGDVDAAEAAARDPPMVPSPGAATMIDTTGTTSAVAAWTKERETRVAETAKLRTAIGELQQRYRRQRRSASPRRRPRSRRAAGSVRRWSSGSSGRWGRGRRRSRRRASRCAARWWRSRARRSRTGRRSARSWTRRASRSRSSIAPRSSPLRDLKVHAGGARGVRRALAAPRRPAAWGSRRRCSLALIVVPIVWRATRVVDAPPPLPIAPVTAPRR